MGNEKLNDVNLTSYYRKKRVLVFFIYFFSLLCTAAALYMMTYQLLGAKNGDPNFYSWSGFEHVFNENSIYRIPNHAYYLVAGFYGALTLALFCFISFIVVLFKTKPNLEVSYSFRKIKRAKVRSVLLFFLTFLVAAYCGGVFFFARWILIDDGKGILLEAGLMGGLFAGGGVLYAIGDLVYSNALVFIYRQLATAPDDVFLLPSEEKIQEHTIPSSVFDELTSDLPSDEPKVEPVAEAKAPVINYIEEAKPAEEVKPVEAAPVVNEEDIVPMAYVPMGDVKEEPKPVKKAEPKPEPKPEPKKAEPKLEPKKKPEPEPEPEPEEEEETYSLKESLKFASTVVEEPPKKNEKPREKITKSMISKTLKKDFPNVEQSKRENYTTTGLPLADTHYVSTPKGKKCFMYVYETVGNPLLLLKIPNYYYRQLKDRGFIINKSQFPKSKLSWSSLVLDSKVELDDVKEAINIAAEFVRTNS